jgi:hypothetical protein
MTASRAATVQMNTGAPEGHLSEGHLWEEILLRSTTEVLDVSLITVGTVLGFVLPSAGTGDFSIVRGVTPAGEVTLASVTGRRRRVYTLDELRLIRPLVIVRSIPRTACAVEEGAWYQEVPSGRLVRAQGGRWLDASGQNVLLPVVPSLLLKWTPSVRVHNAVPTP